VPRCLVVQHIEPETSYAIGRALAAAGVTVDLRRTFAGDPLPEDLEGFAGLVVMGGPMSATSDEEFPTRRKEIGLLAEAVRRAVPTIGVCLGAQLLADAAGGRVVTGSAGPEIGWFPVEFTAEVVDDPLFSEVPTPLLVLHWHGDTFELPPGIVPLASSARYRNQAFRVGPNAWGLQFHLEVDRQAVMAFIEAFGDDVLAAGSTPEAVVAASENALASLARHRTKVLERFADLVVSCRGVAPSF